MHVIKVEVDYNNKINETNETNNIESKEIHVYGAEIRGNTSWESLGLHGTILFDPSQPYDEDDVNITANITNFGYVNATNFSVALLFDYKPSDAYHKPIDIERREWEWSYDNATCIYLDINISEYQVLAISDKSGRVVARTDRSCWIHVPGDKAKIKEVIGRRTFASEYNITVHPVYESNLTRIDRLDVNSSTNVSMNVTNVTAGNHTVMLFIDPGDKVPEDVDNKTDNIVTREMEVLPTMDFTVTKVIPERRTNIYDADVINITANVSNLGYRNGTTKVRFVDYENETRIHKYYFNRSLNLSEYNLSYLPVSPDGTLSSQYKNLTIIHRPGVDAILLNFSWITFYTDLCIGKIRVFNETGVDAFSADPYDWLTTSNKNVLVQGDTAYISTKCAGFNLSGYTTMKGFYREENVALNASIAWNETTKNITAMWSESKNIKAKWNASTGNHNITVIIDPDNEINEINETNNTYALPLSVNTTKDIGIVNLNMSPLHPCNEDEVTIIAVARNKGTERANFTVDLWMDTLKDSSSTPVPYNWSITVGGKRRYITLLNHTELSLAHGEKMNVTAIWENISVYGNPNYVVRAIVDPLDEIEEINEGDNEMSSEIIMHYPDFNVSGFNSPTKETKNASVNIENIGADDASNVTVRLELRRHKQEEHTPTGGPINITKEGAVRIRVYFLELDTTGEKASIDIYGIGEDGKEYKVEPSYSGEKLQNVWSPWVKGDTITIDYCGADFYINKCEWGDENITTINSLDASENVNVSLPERWNKYDGSAFLNVTVDPYDEIVEQREDNNNGTVTIYVDLVPKKGMEYVYGEDGRLKGAKATIMNNKTMKEEKGIAFPVCDFNVTLEVRPRNSDTVVYKESKRIDENQTIYGGEERGVLFDINESKNESKLTANRTYKFTVVADSEQVHSWGELEEKNETNNEYSKPVGPDISVGDIDVVPCPNDPPESCKFTINAVIKNEGDLSARNFSVMLYVVNSTNESDVIEVPNPNKTVGLLYPKDKYPKNETILKFPWDQGTSRPKVYDVTVIADPDNTVDEGEYEWNNENMTKMYADIYAKSIYPDPYAPIIEDTCYIGGIKNTGNLCTGEFDIIFYINSTDVNFPYTNTSTNTINLAPNEEYRFPWVTPLQFNQSLGKSLDVNYNIRVAADPANEVPEPDESNNNGSNTVKVYTHTEYNGTNLDLYKSGQVYGGVSYKLHDSYEGETGTLTYTANFNLDDLPGDADVELARLYLYWTWSYNGSGAATGVPVPIEVNATFNQLSVDSNRDGYYVEYPHATTYDVAWGTYGYKIPLGYVNEGGKNHVRIQRVYPHRGNYYTFAIYGAGLLVIYRSDEEGVWTNYRINEGADVLFDIANDLEGTDLITTATFARPDGTEGHVNDITYANATLWTVVPGGNDETELYFNTEKIGENVWSGNIGNDCRYVTEYLQENDNIAEFKYIGSGRGVPSMMSSNAFLIVGCPPDLEPSSDKVPQLVIGKRYEIPVVINNVGLSDARNFNVSFYADEELIDKKPVNLVRRESSLSPDLTFSWTAPSTPTTVKF
jgi:subtilase family serine protease